MIPSGCGIVGSVDVEVSDGVLDRMTDALRHRGPDARGTYRKDSVTLGHRRLAIVGIDARGNQPFTHDGVALACNGEVYNYRDLRDELEKRGHVFRSECDTEVILHGYLEWGIDIIRRLNGIFAVCLYDSRIRRFYAARDRMGVKPLAFVRVGKGLLFASEPKALFEHPDVPKHPNLSTIRSDILHALMSDKGPTWFADVRNLEPGTVLTFDVGAYYYEISPYWQYPTVSYDQEPDIASLLRDAVRLQLSSDVGVSATCSGGIDSVAVSLLAADSYSKGPLDVFSLSYTDEDGPTAAKADLEHAQRALAEVENVRHHVIPISIEEMLTLDRIDQLVRAFDGGVVFDIRTLSFLKMYEVIRNDYGHRVVLTGQGADELWLGYYEDAFYTYWRFSDLEPETLAYRFFHRIMGGTDMWNPAFLRAELTTPAALRNMDYNYSDLKMNDPLNQMSRFVCRTHFQAILNIDDRIAMQVGLEPRVPWVDPRMVDLAFRVSGKSKLDLGGSGPTTKAVVRNSLKGIIPEEIVRRRKEPFPEPQSKYGTILRRLISENLSAMRLSPLMREILNFNAIDIEHMPDRLMFILLIIWRFGRHYVD